MRKGRANDPARIKKDRLERQQQRKVEAKRLAQEEEAAIRVRQRALEVAGDAELQQSLAQTSTCVALYLERLEAMPGARVGDGADADVAPSHAPRMTQFELQVLNPACKQKHSPSASNIDIGVLRTWSCVDLTS